KFYYLIHSKKIILRLRNTILFVIYNISPIK
ncbi:hypothetical protein A5844_000650, partial [Enterococcus sp. 10A9_DIV0425]